jgi:26S proteasome regulatory subunit N5
VETYGSMDKREKLEFILYQMKIMIKKQDFIRLFIISQKINPKTLDDDNICDLKAQYYAYLITYFNNQNLYLKCVESYKQIFDTLVKHPDFRPATLDFGFNCSK